MPLKTEEISILIESTIPGLSPQEINLAQLVFFSKVRADIISRLFAEVKEPGENAERLIGLSDVIGSQESQALHALAQRLGITDEKYNEICDLVYRIQTNMD